MTKLDKMLSLIEEAHFQICKIHKQRLPGVEQYRLITQLFRDLQENLKPLVEDNQDD